MEFLLCGKLSFKKYFYLFIFIILILFSGCQKIISTAPDELTAYQWQNEFENGTSVTLSFENHICKLLLKTKDSKKEEIIQGGCVITEDEIIIADESMADMVRVKYTLNGNSVLLHYLGSSVELIKLDGASKIFSAGGT